MIENYKDLLFAIFNVYQDNEEGKEFPIIVYDVTNNDMPVAIFKNAITCAKFFETSQKNIQCDVCRKTLKCGRYRLERVTIE